MFGLLLLLSVLRDLSVEGADSISLMSIDFFTKGEGLISTLLFATLSLAASFTLFWVTAIF